jgi:hypothetical protein
VTLFLGWVTHSQPGYRRDSRDNWSLLEFALFDLKKQSNADASGRSGLGDVGPSFSSWHSPMVSGRLPSAARPRAAGLASQL